MSVEAKHTNLRNKLHTDTSYLWKFDSETSL